jgi:tetratricopeptide (TPR) repeat protein
VYARKAFQSGRESAPGHLVLGLIQQYFRASPAQGIRHLKRALVLDPNDVDALFWLSLSYALVGRTYMALPLVERLMERDPHHPLSFLTRARLFYFEGLNDLALKAISENKKVPAEASIHRFWRALLLSYNGRIKEAAEAIDQMATSSGQDIWTRLGLFLWAALDGKTEKPGSLLSADLKLAAQRDCHVACLIAVIYAMLNEREQAMDWLEIAARRGFINYPYLAAGDSFIDNIRAEPRFSKFIKRVKNEWESFGTVL